MRVNKYLLFVWILSFYVIVLSTLVYSLSNSSVLIEADIIGDLSSLAQINIEVSPSSIDFDDVEIGQESDAVRVNITNLGNVDINVVPMLKDKDDEIFKNLIFQKRKTGNSSSEYKIGSFILNILKPSSDVGRKEYCYVKLNLEDVNIRDIDEDSLGHEQAEVIFVALSAG